MDDDRGTFGLAPNTDWLNGTSKLSWHGEIISDSKGTTLLPGVLAAGDAAMVPFQQIIIAVGDGAKAAPGVFDHPIRSLRRRPDRVWLY